MSGGSWVQSPVWPSFLFKYTPCKTDTLRGMITHMLGCLGKLSPDRSLFNVSDSIIQHLTGLLSYLHEGCSPRLRICPVYSNIEKMIISRLFDSEHLTQVIYLLAGNPTYWCPIQSHIWILQAMGNPENTS